MCKNMWTKTSSNLPRTVEQIYWRAQPALAPSGAFWSHGLLTLGKGHCSCHHWQHGVFVETSTFWSDLRVPLTRNDGLGLGQTIPWREAELSGLRRRGNRASNTVAGSKWKSGGLAMTSICECGNGNCTSSTAQVAKNRKHMNPVEHNNYWLVVLTILKNMKVSWEGLSDYPIYGE